MEAPLTDIAASIKKEGANFQIPESAIDGLRVLRPDAIGLANNHCTDQGEQGLLKTIDLLQKNGIAPFGYGKSHTEETGTIYLQKNGFTIAAGAVLSSVISLPMNAIPNRKLLGYSYKEQALDYLNGIVPTVTMTVAVILVGLLPGGYFLQLLLQVGTGVVVYVAVSYILKLDSFMYVLEIAKKLLTRK